MQQNILLIEPYYGGSHQAWADGYQQHSRHNVNLLTLPAQAWKWRMQGGAVTLARLYQQQPIKPDLILASDMMDLSIFRAMTRDSIPYVFYFHENQLIYPQNSRQKHGWRYGFINYASAMCSDAIFFNSQYHMSAFFDELPRMLKHFWDYNELDTVSELQSRSSVLPLGLDLKRFDAYRINSEPGKLPLIVWNHRWEEDKNPKLFLTMLYRLADMDIPFQVAFLGENIRHSAPEFEMAKERLAGRVVQYGYAENFADYARILWQADYVISTANHDFFGSAIAEAIYCGCIPILPDRLNYPALVPDAYRNTCLYQHDNDLLPLVLRFLRQEIGIDTHDLQTYIAQFDWAMIASTYDEIFRLLVQNRD